MNSEAAVSAQTNESGTQPFQTGKVLALSFCHFIHDIYSSFLSPLLPLLIEKLSLSLTQAGLTSTVLQLPALLNPLLGTLADRVSVRYFIILAPMITEHTPGCRRSQASAIWLWVVSYFSTSLSIRPSICQLRFNERPPSCGRRRCRPRGGPW